MSPFKPATVLLTRSQAAAGPWLAALNSAGINCWNEPLLTAHALPPEAMLPAARQSSDWSAALITSGNAVPGLSQLALRRDLPILTVGDTTAAIARRHGFSQVISANGNAADLAALVRRDYSTSQGPLLYLAATTVALDLAAELSADGFTVDRINCYRTQAVEHLQAPTIAALEAAEIRAVALASAETARVFCRLIKHHHLGCKIACIDSFCLSPQIAEIANRELLWRQSHVAAQPHSSVMLDLIIGTYGAGA